MEFAFESLLADLIALAPALTGWQAQAIGTLTDAMRHAVLLNAHASVQTRSETYLHDRRVSNSSQPLLYVVGCI